MKKRTKIIAQELSAKKLLSFRSQTINSLLSITKEGWVEKYYKKFSKRAWRREKNQYNSSIKAAMGLLL
jgi:hypothetical protein